MSKTTLQQQRNIWPLPQHTLLQTLQRSSSTMSTLTTDSAALITHYMQVYPPVKTFITASALLSLLPLTLFVGWVGISSACTLLFALISSLIVESTLVSVGFFILLPIELFIFTIAGVAALVRYGGGEYGDVVERGVQRVWDGAEMVQRRVKDRFGKTVTTSIVKDDKDD
ncbi:hypothetical protein DFS34DRAFT_494853 [Phlyctochytrium arcticum]|nr:hypothetical protein DFS34DRAFT_494853 [Phlyctochytrium arcticum]